MKKSLLIILFTSFVLYSCKDKFPVVEEPLCTIALTNDDFITYKNQAIELDVLFNDTIEGDIKLNISNPNSGSIQFDAQKNLFIYTPFANKIGVDEFSYEVCGTKNCEEAIVKVEVKDVYVSSPCDSIFHAKDDFINGAINSKFIISIEELMNNDESCGVSPDPTFFTITESPLHGKLMLGVDNTLIYIPAADFEGVDRFEYLVRASDNPLTSSSANVFLGVGVNAMVVN